MSQLRLRQQTPPTGPKQPTAVRTILGAERSKTTVWFLVGAGVLAWNSCLFAACSHGRESTGAYQRGH